MLFESGVPVTTMLFGPERKEASGTMSDVKVRR